MLPRVAVLAALLGLALAAPAHADLTWQPPVPGQPLSESGSDADFQRVATNGKGDAVAVWRRFNNASNHYQLEASVRTAGGNFGAPVDIKDSPVGATLYPPRVAIDSQ